MLRSESDVESDQRRVGGNFIDRHGGNGGAGWPSFQEADEPFHRRGGSLGAQLNRPVRLIAHPAGQPQVDRLAPGGETEADSLDGPGDDDVDSSHR